ncbi:hypothetical protein [Paenibacillus sp. Aloe-11]|uniref:hypothetical protein n=1 Tax=Paenibacillus sp. Aloe-11 TaxID=1050222 RepID=UPI00024EFBAC|nr:hypothetical protein [Paenibacillus sp. Aloe-11]EHS54867.1 hypothetical protein WG8_5223 [Paenibacillus sp. Aloe-11]
MNSQAEVQMTGFRGELQEKDLLDCGYRIALHKAEVELSTGNGFRFTFSMPEDGFAELDLLARSESDWAAADRESAFVRLYLNDVYNQDVILYYGSSLGVYTRLLGYLKEGDYEVYAEFRELESAPLVSRAWIDGVELRCVADSSARSLVYRHTPLLYGRNLSHPYENRFTDTPLVLFYSVAEEAERTIIEYQMMFSHEDEGTPAPLLMSKWGRTTDIEWMYRVELDAEGGVLNAVFQGPHHITTPFQGKYALGGHPVLQSATTNGNFTDHITSGYRFMLTPSFQWKPEEEPREAVMSRFPFAYQVTGWEMERQQELEMPSLASSIALASQRSYVFIQTSKYPVPSSDGERALPSRPGFNRREEDACVDIQLRLHGSDQWYSSCHHDLRLGDFRAAYEGAESHFSTTIKLSGEPALDDIAEIRAVLLEGGADRMKVAGLYAFMLNENYLPQQSGIRTNRVLELTRDTPTGILWASADEADSGSNAENYQAGKDEHV